MTKFDKRIEQDRLVYYTNIIYYIPIPEILISEENLSDDLKSVYFGNSQSYTDYIEKKRRKLNKKCIQFKSFIRSVGSLKFNLNYLPLKYRTQFQIFIYQQGKSYHSPYPIYTVTQHNDWIREIREKKTVINPTIKFEVFTLGFVVCELSFVTKKYPDQSEMSFMNKSFVRFLKKIKMSILYALFNPDFAKDVFTQILPDSGYTITMAKELPENTTLKLMTKINFGEVHIFQKDEQHIFIRLWKMSPGIRKDLLLPIKWSLALSSLCEVFTLRIIDWLRISDLDLQKYKELWIAAAQSLNPDIHSTSFEGRSPLFPRDFQKKIFEKVSRVKHLDNRYKEFIKTLKYQGITFAPLAHHAIISLEREGLIDQRLKLLIGIRSNIRRVRVYHDLDLSELEESTLKVLIDKYKDDYKQYLDSMTLDTQNFGWTVLRELGERMGWSQYRIYGIENFDLKRQIRILVEKGLVFTKTEARGRILYIKVNDNNELIKSRLNKMVFRINYL